MNPSNTLKKSLQPVLIAAGLGLVGLGAVIAFAQNQPKTVMGAEGTLFGAKVSSWATLDAQGAVQEVGVTVPMSAIEKAPVPAADAKPPANMDAMMMGPTLRLEFPEVVKKTTFLDHLDLYWEEFGHPPARYITPHFDLHFFGIPSADVGRIDCKNLQAPTPDALPKGYLPAVPPGASAADFCVPLMGFHSLPVSEFTANAELKPGLFDQTLIAGYYDNKYIFTEPMITRAYLMGKQNFEYAVSNPARVGRATLYPTRFKATFDGAALAYRFVYSGFAQGQ